MGGGPAWTGSGERAEGNRQEERKPCLSRPLPPRKRPDGAGGKWRGPRAPGGIGGGWGPGSQASRGASDTGEAPPPTEGRPPSPVAGVTFVSSDVPTQPLTLRPNDRGRLRAPPGLGCHLRKMGSLPPRCAAPRSRGDGGRGGGAEGVNVPGPPPTLRAPPPAAGKRRASAGARLDLRPCPPPPAPVPVQFLVPARPPSPSPRRPELRSARPAPPPPWPGPPCLCGEWGRRAGDPGCGRGEGCRGSRGARAGLRFPGAAGLARRWLEMPGRARRLGRPVGDSGTRVDLCAQPSPAAPLLSYSGHKAPRSHSWTRGVGDRWVPSPIPRASCVLGDPCPPPSTRVSLLPLQELGPPAWPLLPFSSPCTGGFTPHTNKWSGNSLE